MMSSANVACHPCEGDDERDVKRKRLASKLYVPVPFHFKIPHGLWMLEATSVAVDAQDNVIVFNRGNMPVLCFDRDGMLIRQWGNQTPFSGTGEPVIDSYGGATMRWTGTEYARPHLCHVDMDGFVWLVDAGAHCVVKTAPLTGERLMVLGPDGTVLRGDAARASAGVAFEPAPKQSGRPFNTPTSVCVHGATGDIFVSDGYGNSRVHRFNEHGEHILSWGESGTDDGDFNLPHCICIGPDSQSVLVADRENSRVQCFTLDGVHVASWAAHRAVAVAVGRGADAHGVVADKRIFIAEQGSSSTVQRGAGMGSHQLGTWTKNIGHRIGIYDVVHDRAPADQRGPSDPTSQPVCPGARLELVGQIGASTPGEAPGQFNWLHSVAVDSEGSIYAAEVSFCECGKFQQPHAREMVSLRKWRLADAM